MPNYPYARYTKTFLQFIDENPTFLTDTINANTFGKQVYADDLIDCLKANFNFYEIGGETEDTFKTYFEDSFNKWRKYYIEMLDAYTKVWDYTNGTKRKVTNTSEGRSDTSGNDGSTFYDLPHKELATNEFKKYPDNITENTNTSNNHYDNRNVSEYDDSRLYLDQKAQYMNMIRNISNEFCERFKECFIMIYN